MRVHEIGRFHGYRGPEQERVHCIRIFYGRIGPDRDHDRNLGTESRPTGAPEASWRGEGRLLTGLRQGDLAHRYLRGILAWQRETSDWSSARRPRPQVPQWHPSVAKGDF